jgi:putative nucleotidyltransferase with HDIG domain
MSRRILFFATDPAERESIRADLAAKVEGFERLVVTNFDEAITAVQSEPVDAIVADHQMADTSGAKLLNWAAEHCPRAARLIMAESADREEVLRSVLAPHQFLPKPVTPEVLKGTIHSALLLGKAIPNEVLLTLAARIRVFPPLPSLYFRVLNELESPNFSPQTVSEILAKDLAMTTRLLQMINSGFYSLPGRITDLTEAVSLLGQEAVKSLVIAIQVFLEYEHLKPLYFSISQLWQHSTAVAHGARLITQMETGDRDRAEEAYTAGLLHDIGKLVLANNFEAEYNKVQTAACDSGQPLWEVEAEEFGVSHAELGAFILGRWGMPVALLEAAALHHQPDRCSSRDFSAVTAVHIANALEHELRGPQNGNGLSVIDQPYIESLGLLDRIDRWKECLHDRKILSKDKTNRKPECKGAAVPAPSGEPARTVSQTKTWLATAGAVVIITSLGSFLTNRWAGQEANPVHAKSPPGAVESNEAVSTPSAPTATGETGLVPPPTNSVLQPTEL